MEKENFEYKHVKFCLQIDLVSHPARVLHIYTSGTCSVMVIIVGNGHGDQTSNLDVAVCIYL